MDTIKKMIKNDLWVVLLDILAVNLSYYLALVFRANNVFDYVYGSDFSAFYGVFIKFAPVYTILCLIVFYLFRLYGGLWRYVGISDMNRIIGASFVTCAIQIIGSLFFVRSTRFIHMPMTYYALGALSQAAFIFLIRFSYRLFIIERRRTGEKPATALVVGVGELGRQILQILQNGREYHVGCVIDTEKGYDSKFLDGVPVYDQKQLSEALERFSVTSVFLAEPDLNEQNREEIKTICENRGIEVRDYSNFFKVNIEMESNISGAAKVQSGGRKIPFSPPDISEKEISEVVETLRSGWITTGPRTKLLERRLAAYIETGSTVVDTEEDIDRWKDRVICLNSATAAEELNLRILGVGPGDEVIVPAYTYSASASAAIHCGATVRFVDIQKDGDPTTHMPELDYEKLEQAITEKTKAIVTVDLGGIVCDYDRVFEIVERKKGLFTPLNDHSNPLADLSSRIQAGLGRVAVTADCAHSLGASRVVGRTGKGIIERQRKYCGAIADFTDFSFHAVKNFTTAEGGASTWCLPQTVYDASVTDAEIYKMYQLLSLHGQSKDALAKTKIGAWEYDIIGPWYKCNMTDIMAAIGLRQLDRYPELLNRREQIIAMYDSVCDELGISHLIHHTEGMDSSNHLYLIRIPGADEGIRNDIITKIAERGIATNVHYKPLPMMTAYREMSKGIEQYQNSYDYYHNLITLPLHTLLSDEDVEYVCEMLTRVVNEVMEK